MLRRTRLPLLLAALVAAFFAFPAHPHVGVQGTAPAAGDTLDAGPAELRIRFTGRVEAALTVLTLGRDGTHLAAGGRMVEGSEGREYLLVLAAPLEPGTYTVQWRTAGADGHPLQGSWSFVVRGPASDSAAALPADPSPGPAAPPPAAPEAAPDVGDPVAVAVRWAWLLSLMGIVGAVAFRFAVLGRLERDPALAAVARRGEAALWFVALAAAALSVLSLLGRLWLQAAALGGSAWDGDRLRTLLAQTSWGLAWTLQAIATVAFFVGLMVARLPYGRAAGWLGAGVAAILLSTVPALSGHAAASGSALAIVSDAVHVLGGGVWLGSLAALLAVGIPAALTSRDAPGPAVAALVAAFSPLALAGAATVAVTGVVNALFQLGAVSDLWATPYGRALLLKLALLAAVAALGWHHWRRAGPRLGTAEAVPPLRRSIRAEVALGALVLLVTAVLVALPTP
jgi:copper transport protein